MQRFLMAVLPRRGLIFACSAPSTEISYPRILGGLPNGRRFLISVPRRAAYHAVPAAALLSRRTKRRAAEGVGGSLGLGV